MSNDLEDLPLIERAIVDAEFREKFIEYMIVSQRLGCTPWDRYVSHGEVLRRCARAGVPPEAAEATWRMVKMNRHVPRALPLADPSGAPFAVQNAVHLPLEMEMSNLEAWPLFYGEGGFRTGTAPEWMAAAALREEAIATCVLDGVPVDRAAAGEMLETGRMPRSRAEHAVWNAHFALRWVLSHPLRVDAPSPDDILTLHSMLLGTAADVPDAAGRLRLPGESLDAAGAAPIDVAAPDAVELSSRLEKLCAFLGYQPALGMLDFGKAAVVHFWVAYERPFVEGNGRLARLLHYWLLADRAYGGRRLAAVVSLSSLLLRIRPAYARWFREARADDNDLGYFLHPLLQLLTGGLKRSVRMLRALEDAQATANRVHPGALNERQVDVLARVTRHPDRRLTVEAHRRRHGVVYETARTDLLSLADLGLLSQATQGRAFVFSAAADLAERLGTVTTEQA